MLPQELIDRTRERVENFDLLPLEWRQLVWDFGWGVVVAYYRTGLSYKQARHLIELTLNGAYEIRARRREDSRTSIAGDRLAEAMNDIGIHGSPHGLAEALRRRGSILSPVRPTGDMVRASLDALRRRPELGWVETYRKHYLRLQDALDAVQRTDNQPREATDFGEPDEDG